MRDLVNPYWNKLHYVFRMTHISNIPHVMQCGLVHVNSAKASQVYVPIGDQSIIAVRQQKKIFGHFMTEYIPFYFGPRSPMLYVIQMGKNGVKQYDAKEIVYIVVRIKDLLESNIDCVFTDGHAVTAITEFYPKSELNNVNDIIRVEDVYAKYWVEEGNLDLKRRKEAELLCLDEIPVEMVAGYVVHDEEATKTLCDYGVLATKVKSYPDYYF